MKTFAIDSEDRITAFASEEEAEQQAPDSHRFSTIEELSSLTCLTPLRHLVTIWNGIPGATPIKKFTDRKTAVQRTWNVLVHPEPTNSGSAPGSEARPHRKSKQLAKRGHNQSIRPGTKKAAVIAMLKTSKGATIAEIMKATDWQAHSVRGFISGSLAKKMGLKITSIKRTDGQRAYRLKA